MAMVDPTPALVSLQAQIRRGMPTEPAIRYPSVRVVMDEQNGRTRFTYARIEHGRVKAMCMFVTVSPRDNIPCFQIGYAVPEAYRGKGWAVEIIAQGIDELSRGLKGAGIPRFYVEAVIGVDNAASLRVAAKAVSAESLETTDVYSGEPARTFSRLVE